MFKLPELPYKYSELEPYISEETMRIHHTKHHQAYVDGANKAVEKLKYLYLYDNSGSKIEKVYEDLSFNLGGHRNHSFFWNNLAPRSWNKYLPSPDSSLYEAIKSRFGSFSEFKKVFVEYSTNLKGSGWLGLGYNRYTNSLVIYIFQGQDGKKIHGIMPVLLVDLWEHSYYLDYRSDRKRYLIECLEVINWEQCEKVYESYVAY